MKHCLTKTHTWAEINAEAKSAITAKYRTTKQLTKHIEAFKQFCTKVVGK